MCVIRERLYAHPVLSWKADFVTAMSLAKKSSMAYVLDGSNI